MCIPVFLWYTGILTVCQFRGINFLFNIDTGMTEIPSFRFCTGISPSSITKSDVQYLVTYLQLISGLAN